MAQFSVATNDYRGGTERSEFQQHRHLGLRSREWTAIAESEVAVVREKARCLRAVAVGTVPK